MYQRQGIPLGVSTLNDLFHAVATKVDPLYDAMERCLLSAAVIHADETPQRVLAPGKCETGYLWSFSSDRIVLHVHAKNRSGSTPRELLEGTQGVLVADAYSGYNVIEGPNSRLRQGCMAHVRRKFVEALATDPERARLVLRWIACLYQVESHARELYVADPQGWQRLRDERSRPIMANLREWLDENKPQVRPKSPIGRAIGYMISQWSRLCVYLDDPAVPIDNNEAERQLRRPVLGRKTSLFVANHDSGQRYAVNSSVVMTCRKVGVNPTEYLKWLLTVIDDYPARAIDDLLPHNYAETRARMESELDKTG
jgi:transposase